MALTGQQIGDLNLLNKRIAEGYQANQQDLANLEYGKSKGYVYNPMPDNYAKVAGPSGLAGLGEGDIYRLGKDIYSLQIPNTLTMDEMTQGVSIPQVEQTPFNIDSLMGVNTGTDYLNNLIKQQMASTPSQAEYDATRGKIAEYSEEQKTAQRDLQEQKWEQFKLQENFDEINKLMPQIAKAQADYMKFQEEYQNLPYRSRIIGGTADRMARQQAVEMAGLSAIAQAYQGNIDLARNITQDALNAQYQDYANYFNSLSFQLNAIERNLSVEEKNKANALQIAIDERQRQLAEERAQKENIMNLGLTIAQSGGSSEIVSQILKSNSPERAIELAVNSGIFQVSVGSDWTPLGVNEAGENIYYDNVSRSFKTESELLSDNLGNKAIVSASGNVYDMGTYATDTKHAQRVQDILNSIGKFKSVSDIDEYIKKVQPNSKITGIMIADASAKYDIGWEELVALIQHESKLGTSNVARNNNNVGGITWNANFPTSMKGTARPSSEGGVYVKFDSLEDGISSVAYELKKRRVSIDNSALSGPEVNVMEKLQASAIVTNISPRFANNKELINEVSDLIASGVSMDDIEDELRYLTQSENFEVWRNVANTAFSGIKMAGSERQRQLDIVDDYISSGDTEGAMEHIKTAVLGGVSATEKKNITGRDDALASIYVIEDLLEQYTRAGGTTNLLSGSVQKFKTKVLKGTKSQELSNLANEISMAIQKYRQDMTGAQFTDAEAKEYANIYPDITKSKELNAGLIQSLKSAFERNQIKFWERQLGGVNNYNKLQELAGMPIVGVGDINRFNTSTNLIPTNDYLSNLGY